LLLGDAHGRLSRANEENPTMFLKHRDSNDLVEVTHLADLFDPCVSQVRGRFHSGEELQDEESFAKAALVFPSGETLPVCWRDPNYRR
jgi:hypothetical protein